MRATEAGKGKKRHREEPVLLVTRGAGQLGDLLLEAEDKLRPQHFPTPGA